MLLVLILEQEKNHKFSKTLTPRKQEIYSPNDMPVHVFTEIIGLKLTQRVPAISPYMPAIIPK